MHGISTDQERQIREIALSGRLIEAIKLYREFSNASLKEAKNAVEAIMHGTPTHLQPEERNDALLEEQVKQLLKKHQKIQAVRVYREANSCGLKEAKEAVDVIEAQMHKDGYSSPSSAAAISNDPFA